AGWVEAVHVRQAQRRVHFPPSGGQDIRTFLIGASPGKTVSLVNRLSDLIDLTDAVDPHPAERIPEHSAPIHEAATPGDGVAPVDAIRREMDRHNPIVPAGDRIDRKSTRLNSSH